MDQQIGTLQCRYRLLADRSGSLLVRRLDRIAGDGLLDRLAVDLDRWFDDETVYVVRRARASQVLDGRFGDDGPLTRAWAAGLARAIAEAATRAGGDGDVVTFDSTPAFIAAFVGDLIDGRAWERWYYGPFRSYRDRPPPDAARAVLTDHRSELIEVLAYLERSGRLEALLDVVDPAFLDLEDGTGDDPAPTLVSDGSPLGAAADEWRPLVATALRIVERMGASAVARPLEETVAGWVATEPPPLDWRDDVGLSDRVAVIVRWLLGDGDGDGEGEGGSTVADVVDAAGAPGSLADDGVRSANGRGGRSTLDIDEEAVAAAVEPEGWADPERLVAGLAATDESDRLAGRPAVTTPRQRALVAAVGRALSERRPALDASAPRTAANAARLLAALAVVGPGWNGDPTARHFIDLLLAAWDERRYLGAGAVAGGGAEQRHDPGSPAVERLATYGPETADLLAALVATGAPSPRPDRPDGWTPSAAAGVLLLTRVLHDTRLAGWPPTTGTRRPARAHCWPPSPGAGPASMAWSTVSRTRRWPSWPAPTDRPSPRAWPKPGRTSPTRNTTAGGRRSPPRWGPERSTSRTANPTGRSSTTPTSGCQRPMPAMTRRRRPWFGPGPGGSGASSNPACRSCSMG